MYLIPSFRKAAYLHVGLGKYSALYLPGMPSASTITPPEGIGINSDILANTTFANLCFLSLNILPELSINLFFH